MKIPIFTDEVDSWHNAQLAQAFAARGVETAFVSLQDCMLDLSQAKPQIRIPKLNNKPPAAFVRGISGGSMQQVTTRLNVLHMLEMQGVRVMNSGRAIERTVDKAMTSFLLLQANIATPPTWVCESRSQAHEIIAAELPKNKLVLKPLFGSQGRGIRLLEASSKLPLPMDAHVDGVFYLQQFIDAGEKPHDFRVLVVGNQAVAAMRRTGESWLNNVAQGAQCEPVDVNKSEDAEILSLAEQAAKALHIDYCGVDIIRDKAGKLWVIEVNSIPAWRGLQSVTKVNVAQILADNFIAKSNAFCKST